VFDGLALMNVGEFLSHFWSGEHWIELYGLQKFSSSSGLLGHGKGPRWMSFDVTTPRRVPMCCQPKEGVVGKRNYLLPRVSGGFVPLACRETQAIESGNVGLQYLFLGNTLRNHPNIKLFLENQNEGQPLKATNLNATAVNGVDFGLVHWNANLFLSRYAYQTKVISQGSMPSDANEYIATSQLPLPSWKNPMPWNGPLGEIHNRKAGQNSTGLPPWSELRKAHGSEEDMTVPLGFPQPEGSWVEISVRYDGQDGNQYDQLIKETGDDQMKQDAFEAYKANEGKTIDDLAGRSGQEDWAPCEPWGYSWWPVAQINLNVEHNSLQ